MPRKPFHPPVPSPYLPPESDTPGYIIGEHGGVVGFGKRGFYVAAIPAQKARETILRHHYSQSIVNNSYIHLGVYYRDNFAGVLQFGYALNPACAGKIVEGTVQGEYLELNRMWLADVCPRNSESMAISYAVKYIRRQVQASLGYSLSPTNGVEGLASFIRPQTFFISGATSVHFISSTAITTIISL